MVIKWRYLIRCMVLGCLVFLAVGTANNFNDVRKTARRLQSVRGPDGVTGLPVAPLAWRAVKYVGFYAAAGIAVGALLGMVAYLLVRPKITRRGASEARRTAGEHQGAQAERIAQNESALQRKSLWTFLGLLAALLIYIHLRMITLYPSLFASSYHYAWFAGSLYWHLITWVIGMATPILLALFLLRKYWSSVVVVLTRHRTVLVAIGAIFLVGAGGWWASKRLLQRPATNNGPNILVIALDSMRPDHLSWKGLRHPYPRATTPNIDRFLDDCVWFGQAFVPLCRTYPSWMSVLTGCWPPTHGIRFDLPPRDSVLPRVPTMAQTLQRAGYKTAFFLDNTNFAWMEPEVGFDVIVQPPHNAVDFYISSVQPRSILYYYFLNNRLGFLYEPGLRINAAYRAIYKPEPMNREIARFLGRMRYEPKFFQAIHLCSIHVPFCVSYPSSTWFAPSFGPVPNRFGYRPLLDQILEKRETGREFSPKETSWIFTQEMNLYDALTRSADDSFGAILDAIKKAGLYDNSYIVFLADHGENLPEPGLRYRYGSSTHGFFLWGDGDTHIPLAIKFPNQQHAGRRVERLVRTIDIAPTLLDAIGLPPLEKAEGVSRMADVEGRSDDRERWVYAETGISTTKVFIRGHLAYEFTNYPQIHEVDPKTLKIYKKKRYEPNLVTAKDRMIRTERWKLISYPLVREQQTSETVTATLDHRMELFDLATDRNCCNDISTTNPEIARQLRARLQPFIEQDLEQFGTGPVRPLTVGDKERALTTRF